MGLSKAIPFAAVTFVIAGMASMGLPGFSGFVAELQVLIGAWRAFPTLAVLTGVGIAVGVAYTWRAMQKAFFGESDGTPHSRSEHEPIPPITLPEKAASVLLLATSLAVGLYPQFLLKLIIPALNSPIFEGLRRGSWQ